MPITQNPHLIAAYAAYMRALRLRRGGYIANAHAERENLRSTYRLLAGKV